MDFKAMLNQLSQLSEATKETPTGKVHTANPGGYGRKDDDDDDDKKKEKEKEKEKEKAAEPAVKRGRGRPKKGADSETGEVAKYANAPALQSFMVGNLPKGKLPGKTTKKHTLKDWMELVQDNMLAENEVKEAVVPGQNPIPVVGKAGDTTQTGAGFLNIDDTSPAGKAMTNALGDLVKQKKAQIVMPTQAQTSTAKPAQAGATGQTQPGQQGVAEDKTQHVYLNPLGKHGKSPKKVATIKGKVTKQVLDKLAAKHKTDASNFEWGDDTWNSQFTKEDVAEGFNYKQVHSSWSVLPSNKKEFSTPYKLDKEKEARAHAERIGGKLVKIDQRGHIIKTGSKADKGVAEGKLDYSAKKARAGKDIGKPGKQFAKIAKGAAEKYGSEEKGNKVAGAVLKKLRSPQKESIEEGFMDSVKGMFGKTPTAAPSMGQQPSSTSSNMDIDLSADPNREPYRFMRIPDNASREIIKSKFRTLAKKYHPDMQGGNSDIMAKLNTAMARIAYRMGITRLEEVDLPSAQMDMGAGLGAGRSPVRLESKKAKPDFLDLDKDKNKKESMAKAAKDAKKKKKVTESSHRHSAAKLLGKSHALAKEGYNCRFEDMDEARMYHEGYKEGLDECYGQGVYEMAPPATVPGMASAAMSMPSMEEDMFDEAMFDEGNAFTGALAHTPKGGKFSLGGKTFTDTSDLDEMSLAFESLDKQLKSLLESEEVSEGMTVSISKGQQGMPDSVTVSAQDGEADQLLGLIKQAGLGLFGDNQSSGYGAPADSQDTKMHGDISVVGDHDGMMGLMKKFAGIEGGQSQDYEDEEGHDEHDDHDNGEEEVCETCNQSQCQCDESEHIEEVESEDQMEFEVAEDQSDAEEEETTADENAEAKEDQALAVADSNSEEEQVEESLANGADDTFEADIHFMTKAIASGLNKEKSTGQTTIPVIAGQTDRMGYNTNESVQDWKKLAGIK